MYTPPSRAVMQSRNRVGYRWFALLPLMAAALMAFAIAPARAGEEGVPKGVAPSDWSSIRAAYDAGRHAATPLEGGKGYLTHNPGQRWSTAFDGRGFTTAPDAKEEGWSWGLELSSYGREGAEHTVTAPSSTSAQGGRVAYTWNDTLTEWYINDTRGFEHGYTVNRRPAGNGPLWIVLTVRGPLQPSVSATGRDVTFVNAAGTAVVNYRNLVVVDADGTTVPAKFEAIDGGLWLHVDDHAARYPLTIDPIAQQAYLKASNTGVGDQFGRSVAVSGDTVVVGAPFEASNATGVNSDQADNSASGSGAAYVFVRSGTGGAWTQQAYLKASNTGANDNFGLSVAVSGDTVVVGASLEDSNAVGVNGNQGDNSASASGAAYVFVRSGTGGAWTQQAYLKASNTAANDNFGVSVAVSDDTVVVGANAEDSNAVGVNGNQADNSASNSGAAYVFVRSGTGGAWTQQAYLKASNTEASDNFGIPVAVSGDTVVVGANLEDSNAVGVNGNQGNNSAAGSGAAYVFVRSGTGGAWSQLAYLKASNTDASDQFGVSVAVSDDTVIVGSNAEDSNAVGVNGDQADNSVISSGAAYVFNILLAIDPCAGQQPVIVQHPSSQSVTAAGTAGFTAAATSPSGSALSYQWQRNGFDLANGGNIAGATTPTLTISPASLTDNGSAYACIVTNSCGSTSTRPAGLAVTTAPRCLADLGSQGGLPGADGFLDNNDFVIFIDAFFSHTGCP